MEEIVLSICIPTYNRGHRALALVSELRGLLDTYDNIEIIVSNNGSNKHLDGYETIEKMCIDRLRYHKFDENQYFWGNVNQVLKMAKGRFALLISDEDNIEMENLDHYLELCSNNPDISVIRSKTLKLYTYIVNETGKKGYDAIKKFFLCNNYMSGVLYNKSILTNEIIDRLYDNFKDNIAYRFYPHMVFDAYCLVQGDFLSDGFCLINEGDAEKELADVSDVDKETKMQKYTTYESRLEQQRGFVDIVKNLWCATEAEKARMFMRICEKTIMLLTLVREEYEKQGVPFHILTNKYREQCMSDIEYINLPVINGDIATWIKYVETLIDVCSNS